MRFRRLLLIGAMLLLTWHAAGRADPRPQRVSARPPHASQDMRKPGVFPNEQVTAEGQQRQFRLIVPETVDLSKPAPLVVAFHGMLIDNKDVMPRYTSLDETASENRFILAFPRATGRSWGISPEKVTADLAFFDALVADIAARYRIDPQRLYVVGMSNGAYFAHLVARERSRQVAAACSHSGPLGLQTLLGVHAARKFPVMIVHGALDEVFPVAFARENCEKYRREKHNVEYVEVPKLTHAWASEVKINNQIWKFFAANPLGD